MLRRLLLSSAFAICFFSTSCLSYNKDARREYPVEESSIIKIDGKRFQWVRRVVDSKSHETATYLEQLPY